jgi:hypothetical protein
MTKRNSADKVILLTLIDLLLQLLFLFLFAVIVVSNTALSDNEWKDWTAVKEQIGRFHIDIPTFGPTWQQGQIAIAQQAEEKAKAKAEADVEKPFNEPCIPPPKESKGQLTRVYIGYFAIQDDGISLEPMIAPKVESAEYQMGRQLLESQVKQSNKKLWNADEFTATFKPFRDRGCEYYVRILDKMESNDKKKYQIYARAIRSAFGPDRSR